MTQGQKIGRAVAITLLVLGLGGQVWNQKTWDDYFNSLPRSPDPKTGHIYPDNFHGIAVYETREERIRLYAVEYPSFALSVVGIILGLFVERRSRAQMKYRLPAGRPR